MRDSFTYVTHPARVIFGSGTLAELGKEAERLDLSKVLVLTTPAQAGQGEAVMAQLGATAVGLFDQAAMHTPVAVTERAVEFARERAADGLISIGGGSTTGLGKAITLRTGLPQIAVATSYAGSEMTPILGQTEGGKKTTLRDAKVLPKTVVYDVDLTLGMPPKFSATSGINAMAHAVEALYARNGNPVMNLLAEEGIRALAQSLPKIVEAPDDADARTRALYGAWLCATCLATSEMALHHKLCHVLGGSFDLPHAETHTVVLPHAFAFNATAAPEAAAAVARAVESDEPAAALFDLAHRCGVPTSLQSLEMPEAGIADAVSIALENPYWNPRPLDRDGIEAVIRSAWEGARPSQNSA